MKNKIINTGKEIRNLAGGEIKDGDGVLTVGRVLGAILATAKSVDPLRSYVLAQKLYGGTSAELDASEVIFVEETIKRSETFTPLIVGQILEALQGEDKEKK